MKKKPFTYAGKSIRGTWTINPVTRVKGNEKKEAEKKACRKSKGKPRDTE